MDKSTVMKNYRFLALVLFVMVADCMTGWFFSESGHFIKPADTVFINMTFCAVVPLAFASISDLVASVCSRRRAGKIIGTTMLAFVATDAVATAIMFIAMKLVPPVLEPWTGMATEAIGERASPADMIVSFFTIDDFVDLLSHSAILPLIVFSILFDFATNLVGDPDHATGKLLDGLTKVMMAFMKIITYYAPIVFPTLFADLVATYGFSVTSAYGRVAVVYCPLCFIYAFTAFPLFACIDGDRYDIKTVFQHIVRPAIMSLSTCSSSATIPTNLREAEDTGIPKDVADMAVLMGITIHMDGSCSSCVLKIALVLRTMGVDIPWTMLLAVVAVAVLSSMGMSGIPGGGYIDEYIICSIFSLQQAEATFPILMAVGNPVDPPTTIISSAGGYAVCYIVARATDDKGWLDRAIAARHVK